MDSLCSRMAQCVNKSCPGPFHTPLNAFSRNIVRLKGNSPKRYTIKECYSIQDGRTEHRIIPGMMPEPQQHDPRHLQCLGLRNTKETWKSCENDQWTRAVCHSSATLLPFNYSPRFFLFKFQPCVFTLISCSLGLNSFHLNCLSFLRRLTLPERYNSTVSRWSLANKLPYWSSSYVSVV